MNNPLLTTTDLPLFSQILPNHIEPAIDYILAKNREQLRHLLSQTSTYTWENLIEPLEGLAEALHIIWSPISHLYAVVNKDALRQAYRNCLLKITNYETELSQDVELYQAIKFIAESPNYPLLTAAQQKVITNILRDFRLAGIELSPTQRQRYAEILAQLSSLESRFEEHLLDATDTWQYNLLNKEELDGLPIDTITDAEEKARYAGKSGWLLTLSAPCYNAVMNYANSRLLRQIFYTAYTTRASDQGPYAGKWDNSKIMEEIIELRYELAQLIGFTTFAEYSLATKMAKHPQRVITFLKDLVEKIKPKAKQELLDLKEFAKKTAYIDELEPWDIAYFSEKQRQEIFNFSEENLRPYFSVETVLAGMFQITERLYDVKIKETPLTEVWHPDVKFFTLYNQYDQVQGMFYLDLYARPQKRSGAWMDELRTRRQTLDESLYLPVAYLTCNFHGPSSDQPALLTHDEVITLFHEFGHGLHHLLTEINHRSISGIHGVAWDAVEIPSQLFENWCWQPEALTLYARHYQTSQQLPVDLIEKMLLAKNYQSALQLIRQLELSLFDFYLHLEDQPMNQLSIQEILNKTRAEVAVFPVPSFNRFQHSFAHIFSSSYAAGYYSYLWAEVLSCDIFAKFKEAGIFNSQVSQRFLSKFLAQGGAQDALDLFIDFMGRPPQINSFLQEKGIISP